MVIKFIVGGKIVPAFVIMLEKFFWFDYQFLSSHSFLNSAKSKVHDLTFFLHKTVLGMNLLTGIISSASFSFHSFAANCI